MEVAGIAPAWCVCSAPLWPLWVWLCRTRTTARVGFFSVSKGFQSVCLSLAGRSWSLIFVKEQSRHFCQSGKGRRHDPVSGCVMFWACTAFFCSVCSMFIARGLSGMVTGTGVTWSGEEQDEGGPGSSFQLLQSELQR